MEVNEANKSEILLEIYRRTLRLQRDCQTASESLIEDVEKCIEERKRCQISFHSYEQSLGLGEIVPISRTEANHNTEPSFVTSTPIKTIPLETLDSEDPFSPSSGSGNETKEEKFSQINPKRFSCIGTKLSFNTLKAASEEKVRKSISTGVWEPKEVMDVFIKKKDEDFRNGEDIFFFIHVAGSNYFCGVAKMCDSVLYSSRSKSFKLQWIFVKDIHFKEFSHLQLPSQVFKLNLAYVKTVAGKRMMNIFEKYQHKRSLLAYIQEADKKESNKNGQVHGETAKVRTALIKDEIIKDPCGFDVGQECFAKWEDGVWYTCLLLEKGSDGFLAHFPDYNDEDWVAFDHLVPDIDSIPVGDLLERSDLIQPEDLSSKLGTIIEVSSVEEYQESRDNTSNVSNSLELEDSVICNLCRMEAKRPMNLVCNRKVRVCWGCAVKEINLSRVCWVCKSSNITTEDHLVKVSTKEDINREFEVLADEIQEKIMKHKLVDDDINVEGGIRSELNPSSAPQKCFNVHESSEERDPTQGEELESISDTPLDGGLHQSELFTSGDLVKEQDGCDAVDYHGGPKTQDDFQVGEVCFARWDNDNCWYNVTVQAKIPHDCYSVLFHDYGNVDSVAIIVKTLEDIPVNSYVDENVVRPYPLLKAGDKCFARWQEDKVWYFGEILRELDNDRYEVLFLDYGNSDEVKKQFVVEKFKDLPMNIQLDNQAKRHHSLSASFLEEPMIIDYSSTSSDNGELLLSLRRNVSFLSKSLQSKFAISNVMGPVGIAIMQDKTLAIVCRKDHCINIYSRSGKYIRKLKGRKLKNPTDILVSGNNGNVFVRDCNGIQMLDKHGVFKQEVGVGQANSYYGLAEDDRHIITINCNIGDDVLNGSLTKRGQTDLFLFEKVSMQLVKRIELADITGDSSNCLRSLYYRDEKLYILDITKNCVYSLYDKDGEERAGVFGESGSGVGQFSHPAGMVVDDFGSMIVVDSLNHRLQLVDSNWNFCGNIQADTVLRRPSGICFDSCTGEMLVSNYETNSVICYSLC